MELQLQDSFQRLLMHGIAQYHSLQLLSCGEADQRHVRVSLTSAKQSELQQHHRHAAPTSRTISRSAALAVHG